MTTPPSGPPKAQGLKGLIDRILTLVLNKSWRPVAGGDDYWDRALDAQLGWPQANGTPPTKPTEKS
jgi:hypothetical protein